MCPRLPPPGLPTAVTILKERPARPILMKRICVVTACGNKKREGPLPAHRLYKSPRITAVYKHRCGHDMYILSAEHGLLDSEKIIESYDRIMDEQRSHKLIPSMVPVIQKYDVVIFYKGGSRKLYEQCIQSACDEAGRKMIPVGFKIHGDINTIPEIIRHEEK